jgi:hypothetical protein
VPVGLGAARADVGDAPAEPGDRLVEALGAELVAVVDEHALELPAGGGELRGDPARELGGLGGGGVALWADDQVGPAEVG